MQILVDALVLKAAGGDYVVTESNRVAVEWIEMNRQVDLLHGRAIVTGIKRRAGHSQVMLTNVPSADGAHLVEIDPLPLREVVAVLRARVAHERIGDDSRRYEHHDFIAVDLLGLLPESNADPRQTAQIWNLRSCGGQVFANETANYDSATIRAEDVRRNLSHGFLRQREPLLDLDRPGGKFRVNFQTDQAVVGDEGPDAKERADIQEIDRLCRGAFGHGCADVAEFLADLDF